MKTNIKEINQLHSIDLYLHFYEDFIDDLRTKKECDMIIDECKFTMGNQLLDLACGHGRHSIELAIRKYDVTGIDLNETFIQLAKSNAEERGLKIDFIVDNMMNLDVENHYDGIIILYNSFGFLDRKDGDLLIKKMKRALRENGMIFLDVRNKEAIPQNLDHTEITKKGDDRMIDHIIYNRKEGTTTNHRVYIKDGKRYEAPFTMQMYDYSEIEYLLKKHELSIVKSFGNWDKSTYRSNLSRIILVIGHS